MPPETSTTWAYLGDVVVFLLVVVASWGALLVVAEGVARLRHRLTRRWPT